MVKKKTNKKFVSRIQSDFSRENFIEGGIIRPIILMASFFTFIIAMFVILSGNLKWGGSLIIFSFILNIYSIYESLTDKESIFRTLNLVFKLLLFISEIIAFNYILTII